MLREIDFAKVSDGKFYQLGDMVKADCQGCAGCSECCRGLPGHGDFDRPGSSGCSPDLFRPWKVI